MSYHFFTTVTSAEEKFIPMVAALPPSYPALPQLMHNSHQENRHRCEACNHLNSVSWRLDSPHLRNICEGCGMPCGVPPGNVEDHQKYGENENGAEDENDEDSEKTMKILKTMKNYENDEEL
jgi:hypothetical protein